MKSGATRSALTGCAPRSQPASEGEHHQRAEGDETRKPHVFIIRTGRYAGKGHESHGSREAGSSGESKYKPVLGLSDEPGEPLAVPARAGTVYDQPEPEQLIELTVIVPARNEEQSIGECLRSLVAQSESVFRTGARLGTDRGGRSLDGSRRRRLRGASRE